MTQDDRQEAAMSSGSKHYDIVFDGPPSEPGRFVEVEDDRRAGVSLGEWVERDDGYWVLRIHGGGHATVQHERTSLPAHVNLRYGG